MGVCFQGEETFRSFVNAVGAFGERDVREVRLLEISRGQAG